MCFALRIKKLDIGTARRQRAPSNSNKNKDLSHLTIMQSNLELSLVIPCFNEADNLELLISSIEKACLQITHEIILVNDGSRDSTKEKVAELQKKYPHLTLINFLANAGHQNALRAGLKFAQGKFVITMDADLQHPPDLIPTMLSAAKAGHEIVTMVRSKNQAGLLKNIFSKLFYRFFNSVSKVKMVPEASDFRLISQRVCTLINSLPERSLVLRALIPLLGFSSTNIEYQVQKRHAGTPGYSFKKSCKMALDSVFNFTTFPLELGFRVGVTIAGLSFAYAMFNIYARLFTNRNVPGYTDIICSILFLSGIILIYLGVLGRYITLILEHLKNRPEYIIESVVRNQ